MKNTEKFTIAPAKSATWSKNSIISLKRRDKRRIKRTVDKEQYFTAPDLARRCVEFTNLLTPLSEFETIIEPSAGDGVFLEHLPTGAIAIDIEPKGRGIQKQDFFQWLPQSNSSRVLTIGNPPFGQRGALAVKFILHACRFSSVVAFILPRSFNKYTFQNRIPLNFHLAGSFECSEFFRLDGKVAPVKCVFQVWQKRDDQRILRDMKANHVDFNLKHCHVSRTPAEKLTFLKTHFPWAIPQVGNDFSVRESSNVQAGSWWFIRPENDTAIDVLRRLNFDFLNGMNTAFTSLSKRDIIAAYDIAKGKKV